MKKILIIISLFMILIMMSCIQENNYYEEMTPLIPPIEHQISGKSVWITHEKRLNDNEILYYAPKSLKIDDDIYFNDDSNYYIYTIKPSIFQYNQYRIASTEELKIIFN